jgi:hypothetical protein
MQWFALDVATSPPCAVCWLIDCLVLTTSLQIIKGSCDCAHAGHHIHGILVSSQRLYVPLPGCPAATTQYPMSTETNVHALLSSAETILAPHGINLAAQTELHLLTIIIPARMLLIVFLSF